MILVCAEKTGNGSDFQVRTCMDGVCSASFHDYLFGHTVDPAFVLPANRAVKNDPIAFLVANAFVLWQ